MSEGCSRWAPKVRFRPQRKARSPRVPDLPKCAHSVCRTHCTPRRPSSSVCTNRFRPAMAPPRKKGFARSRSGCCLPWSSSRPLPPPLVAKGFHRNQQHVQRQRQYLHRRLAAPARQLLRLFCTLRIVRLRVRLRVAQSGRQVRMEWPIAYAPETSSGPLHDLEPLSEIAHSLYHAEVTFLQKPVAHLSLATRDVP